MIHCDSDEGPVPIEVLQARAAKAKDAEIAELRARLERAEGEVSRLKTRIAELETKHGAGND